MAGHEYQGTGDGRLPQSLLQVARGDLKEERPRMPKVPPLLRQQNKDENYDPLIVSLGPYHHGEPQLQLAEKFKLRVLHKFVEGSDRDVQYFYKEILKRVTFCRFLYDQESTKAYDDPTFAQMMLLDSCFIIHYIWCTFRHEEYKAITSSYLGNWYSGNVTRDLYLLENQIPFELLEFLMHLRFGEEGVQKLYYFLFGSKMEDDKIKELVRSNDRPFHILDGLWLADTYELRGEGKTSNFPWYHLGCLKHVRHTISRCVYRLSNRRYLKKTADANIVGLFTGKAYTFRSATDIKTKGIYCKPSSSWSRRSIIFKSGSFFATLEVPVRYVTIHTKAFLMNLIAFEMLLPPDQHNKDLPMSAYVDFMKSLIDIPADVKELRERKILFTTLGTDEEVVNLFNDIITYNVGDELDLHYRVKRDIEAQYNNKAMTWLAEFLHTYFNNPWSAIALLTAVFLLILTVIQTYYAIQPSPENKKLP